MPSKKDEIVLKKGKVPSKILDKLRKTVEELYGVDPSKYIPLLANYVCFNEFCILYSGIKHLEKISATRLFEGSWIGVYYKKLVVPSVTLVKHIYAEVGTKAAVVVAEQGVKAFLYGNDVLLESVLRVIPPRKGLYAVIDSLDGEVIGFAKWDPARKVYMNVYDLGMFLRILG